MRFTLATSLVALAVLVAAAPQPVGQKSGLAIPIMKRSGLANADKSVNTSALQSHMEAARAYVGLFLSCVDSNIHLQEGRSRSK